MRWRGKAHKAVDKILAAMLMFPQNVDGWMEWAQFACIIFVWKNNVKNPSHEIWMTGAANFHHSFAEQSSSCCLQAVAGS